MTEQNDRSPQGGAGGSFSPGASAGAARVWPPGFAAPNWSAPLGDEPQERSIPPDGTVKGFFFRRTLDELDRRKLSYQGERRYASFKDYPMSEYRALLLRAATLLYPILPEREALRRLGQLAYPTLAATMIGRVIFGVLGDDLQSVMKAAAKGYKVSIQPGTATVLETSPRHALVRLEELYLFVDSYQVGVFEGAITACKRLGEIALKPLSPISAELYCTWS